jgi:hypothetical protein
MDDEPGRNGPSMGGGNAGGPRSGARPGAGARQAPPPANNAMAAALAKLKR